MNTLNVYPSDNAGLDCAPHKFASAEKSHPSMKMLTIIQDKHCMYSKHLTSPPLVLNSNQTLGTLPKTYSGAQSVSKSRAKTNRPKLHKIWGSHSSAAAHSSRLGCDAVLLGQYFPVLKKDRSASEMLGTTDPLTQCNIPEGLHLLMTTSQYWYKIKETHTHTHTHTHSSKTTMYKYVTICITPPNTTICNYIHIPFKIFILTVYLRYCTLTSQNLQSNIMQKLIIPI